MTIRRSMMLMEAARLRALILEAREDGLMKRFVPIIVKNMAKLSVQLPGAWATIRHYEDKLDDRAVEKQFGDLIPEDRASSVKHAKTAMAVIMFSIQCDPDPKQSYTTWMLVMFCKGLFNLEDMPRVTDALIAYQEAKKANLIPRSHDLGTVKTLDDLYEMVNQFRADSGNEIIDRAYEATMYQQADVWIDTPEYKMLTPNTEEASQWFGRHTEWCTAWGGKFGRHQGRNCLYSSYAPKGRLYIIQRKSDGVMWQFHRETNSYMDVNDRGINISQFVQENPEIAHWFAAADAKDMGNQVAEIRTSNDALLKLYDNGNGRIFSRDGIGLGSRMADFTIDYDEDECIQGMRVGYHEQQILRENGALVEFLNSRFNVDNVPMDRLGDLVSLEITYKKGHGFGRPRDLGEQVWSAPASDGDGTMIWIKINSTEFRLYCDSATNEPEDNTLYARTRVRTRLKAEGSTETVPDSLVFDFDQSIRDGSTDIMFEPFCAVIPMLNLPKDIYHDSDSSRFNPLLKVPITDPLYRKLVSEYPNVDTIKRSVELNGLTETLKERIRDVMANTISSAAKFKDMVTRGEDEFSIYLFKDIAEAIDTVGTDDAKHVMSSLDDGLHNDYSEGASDDQRRDLWDSLNNAQQARIVEWIFSENPEVDRDDFSEHDFTESSDFIELYDAAGQPSELDHAFDRAVETSYRYGAEEDMSKALDNAVSSSPLVFFDTKKKTYSIGEQYIHDTPCAWFIKYQEVLEFIQEDESDQDINNNANVMPEELEWKIDVSIPYYGWSGWDEKAGEEDFVEALYEAGIIDRRQG